MKRKIKTVDIKLTDTCNLNCKMCGQRSRKEGIFLKNYVNLNDLKIFFDKIPEDINVYLWGGEPFMHPNIKEIIDFFISKKSKVAINTNGLLLDKHMDFLIKRPIDSLIVSIDGILEVHDSIRGKKNLFSKIKQSLHEYIEKTRVFRKKNIIINFTILKENYLQMEEFCREVKSWDVFSITMNFLILVDKRKGEQFRKEILSKYNENIKSWIGYSCEYEKKFDYIKFSKICNSIINEHGFFVRWTNENFVINAKNLKLFYEKPNKLLPNIIPLPYNQINKKCKKIENSIVIDSNGNVVLCPDFPDTVIGNIKKSRVEDFTSIDKYKKYGLYKNYKAICYRCRHRS